MRQGAIMQSDDLSPRAGGKEIETQQQYAAGLLKGRVAFITGGATGIGFGIARHYVRLGANVAIASRNQANLDQAVERLAEEGAGEAIALRTDVRTYDEVRDSIGKCVKRFGALDILVNNAAGNFLCPTAKLSPNGWRTVLDIDLNGTFYCCHAGYEALKASVGGGCIISIASTQSFTGWPNTAHAAAAKAGIISLSRTLAVEWGPDNIRVNTISPGPIADTEGVRRLYEQSGMAEVQRRRVALGRYGSVQDIGNAAVFLASPLANYVTGADFIVDGGRWLNYVAV